MRAVVCTSWGGPEVLQLQQWPDPQPAAGHVVIEVAAFGLNRAELFTRRGDSPGVALPRVIGIECVGTVASAPGTRFSPGDKVVAMMGGMGRQFDGSYAERTRVPASSVFVIRTSLPWAELAALPEMFQTCNGSLRTGLALQAGEVLLIRGGTSSIGLLSAALAKQRGATVIATTRQRDREEALRKNGADHVLVDGGALAAEVHRQWPGGVDKVLELVGTTTLGDSLRCARPGGVVCMTGILGGLWVWPEFQPMIDIPTGVRLTSYSGGAGDVTEAELQGFIDAVEAGTIAIRRDRCFRLDELPEAHRYMEANRAVGKCVGVVS